MGDVSSLPVRIVAVGDELLEGRTTDTNSGCIQRALAPWDAPVAEVRLVPDRADAIAAALDATAEGDLVFVTGGLGSTPDDLTRDAVAAWAGVPLEVDAGLRSRLEERWRRRGLRMRAGVERQSEVPAGLTPVANPVGSAPGLVGRLCGRTIVLLPGVPAELEGLLPPVLAQLEEEGAMPTAPPTRLWRTAQVAELALVEACAPVRAAWPDLRWSWWLTSWGADVRVAAPAGARDDALDEVAVEVDRVLAHIVFSRERATLPETVLRLLQERGRTVATAESCTAGLIAGRLTDPAGASSAVRGGIVAYADTVKTAQLDVPAPTLATFGAVSEETVRAMATGCRRRFGVDHTLAVSGISGPGGGTADKPVGTTWVAVAGPGGVHARRYRFPADRAHNRRLTVAAALDALRRVLEFGDDASPWRAIDSWRGDR